jgi:hypothetical protein
MTNLVFHEKSLATCNHRMRFASTGNRCCERAFGFIEAVMQPPLHSRSACMVQASNAIDAGEIGASAACAKAALAIRQP